MESILTLQKQVYQIGVDKIDWKALRNQWDENILFFSADFRHGENKIQIQSELSGKRTKRYILVVYVNGLWKGEWMNKEHPMHIYMNKKELKPSKAMKELIALNKKMAKIRKEKYKEPDPYYLYLPTFASMNEVKRMIENLPKP